MFLGSIVLPVRRTDNLTASCLDNVGSSTSHNPIGLHWPVTGIALVNVLFTYVQDHYEHVTDQAKPIGTACDMHLRGAQFES
jgi:hypothetical protein